MGKQCEKGTPHGCFYLVQIFEKSCKRAINETAGRRNRRRRAKLTEVMDLGMVTHVVGFEPFYRRSNVRNRLNSIKNACFLLGTPLLMTPLGVPVYYCARASLRRAGEATAPPTTVDRCRSIS